MKEHLTTLFKELDKVPHNTVILAAYLSALGINRKIQYNYKQKGWLNPIASGAFLKFGDEKATFEGAIYTLQKQANLKIHIGGLSALILNGHAHYMRNINLWQLFGQRGIKLPRWFIKYDFGKQDTWKFYNSDFLPYNEDDFIEYDCKAYTITIANPERSFFEALDLTPDIVDLDEIAHILDLMSGLRPIFLNRLLQTCKSYKVKRLFLYLSEKAGFDWFKYLDLSNVDLGKGVYPISKIGGIYDKKYNIVIKELDAHHPY